MPYELWESILLVCGCEDTAPIILEQFYDSGFSVVGPAATAGMALALAAQTSPSIAVVATPPKGRCNATELGRDLLNTWGIRSWVLERAIDPADNNDELASWSASPERIARIQKALKTADFDGRVQTDA